MTETDKTEYASYNGLARNALTFGVPTITLISLMCFTLFSLILGVWLVGAIAGLVLPALSLALIFVIKFKCEEDSRAVDEWMWELKGAYLRALCQSSIASFSSYEESARKRRKHVQQFFKDHPDCR
ncbi:conjugal transfer protein traD [Enterovibrio calviensis]|uniref:conjugal transfer protein traD n=1 Tax=Enterovibrio calviensis TaxID=91359 RepID=UPI003735C3E5